ncbi:MAG: cell division topological specificity factor MinE, partial [Synergistaceae bacterium]|nr:cell division topological specificity factor MinE [Synergistaceae bacterium]
MDFLKRIFGSGSDGSRGKAKDRLKIVLIHDRTDISPQLLDNLRGEIVEVLTKYMEIDTQKIEIDLDHDEHEVALVANVPVLRIKRGKIDELRQIAVRDSFGTLPVHNEHLRLAEQYLARYLCDSREHILR